MPKTRPDLNRDEKVAEILEATERRLREGGVGAVSVAAVARELGLAHNAIYWYFSSKDHLLVATFEHMVQKVFAAKPKEGRDVAERVMWFVDQLGELYPIRASMHDQVRRSGVIADYLDELNDRLRRLTSHVLEPHVDKSELDVATSTFIATVQGAFLQGVDPEERRQLVTFAFQKLIGGGK
ncbi:MAG: TetR/AcrR family transcriptional regulator [Actinomycetota bacterium]|nr:TetR/AcrR family transcriptional regulator [Actinomycetota bacterium]